MPLKRMTSVRVVTFVLLRDLTTGKELAMYQEHSPFIWKCEGPIWLKGKYTSCFLVLQTIIFYKNLPTFFFFFSNVTWFKIFSHKVVMALQTHVQGICFHSCCQNLSDKGYLFMNLIIKLFFFPNSIISRLPGTNDIPNAPLPDASI